jgi:hypothetical protein
LATNPGLEFQTEASLFLRGEESLPSTPAGFGFQLDMPVIQRVDHSAKDVEELAFAGLTRDLGSVGVVLLFPVDLPQPEKRIPVVEGLPQLLEILLGVAIDHGSNDLGSVAPPESRLGCGLAVARNK